MYAVNQDLEKRSWLSAPVNKGKMKKVVGNNKIKYPIFSLLAKIEVSPFWISYLERAAKGKFPKGFSYNGKELIFLAKNGTFFKSKVTTNDEKTLHYVKHMYREYGYIYSPEEQNIAEAEVREERREETKWNKCNNIQKETLIIDYVNYLTSFYNLDRKGSKQLSQLIRVGITIGCFNNNNIIIEDEYIKEIKGLKRIDEDFGIDQCISPYKPKKTESSVSKKKKGDPYMDTWNSITSQKKTKKSKTIEVNIDEDESG